MPNELKKNGCHAWQGCGDGKSIEKYDPDMIVISPSYAHYNYQEYARYILNNEMILIKERKSKNENLIGQCNQPNYLGLGLYIFNFKVSLGGAIDCVKAYLSVINNYSSQNIIIGDDIKIYKKNSL